MANEFQDIGREIKNAVLDAVNSGDFSQLNSRITGSVGAAIDEVNERLKRPQGSGWQNNWATPPAHRTAPGASASPKAGPAAAPARAPAAAPTAAREPALYSKRPKGSVSGLVCTILGGIFLGLCGISLLALGILALSGVVRGLSFFLPTGLLVPLLLGSAVVLWIGVGKSARVARFRRYVAVMKGKTYCTIAELSKKLEKKEGYVLRDLKTMISLGMFPQGHIDEEGKTLLLTDELFSQYQELKRQRREQASQEAETPEEKLYRETAEKGQNYLEVIRRANDAIPGEAVSEKLYRLEDVVRKIFDQVKCNPEQIPELRRFLDYYMPTTLKLVETYEQLDRQDMAGPNIETAKQEIEKTLDTINLAFENLFDSLFAHTAVDISSDISVLKTMLKQEGLTEKDFTT